MNIRLRKLNKWKAFLGLLLGYFLLAACSVTLDRMDMTFVRPPTIEGSSYIGVQSCAECHQGIVDSFEGATHAKLVSSETNLEVGCESCHGPGSIHNQSGGEIGTIHNPSDDSETCFQCHLDVRGSFNLSNSHPVGDGNVSCNDCHDPHTGSAIKGGGTALMSESDTCYQCHQAQVGPFVFEHEARQDGCTVCHSPHGSVNQKLLKSRNATLCLQCHSQLQTDHESLDVGGRNHASSVQRGTCWTAGCHEEIHGSHISSSLRF